ncbi:hypothetical protein YTPLAS72_14240 [Nitrospira sp.]|nr:hypothetical protein YTPLAS72_14240 [Nitrospira sp.]
MSRGEDHRKAVELYRLARTLEAQGDYVHAKVRYEESLALCEDQMVRRDYLKLLATVGPK